MVVIVALAVVPAPSSFAQQRELAFGPAQLTRQLATQFPQKRCLLAIACVTLTDPVVSIRAGDPRLHVTARARPDLAGDPIDAGTVEMAGLPRYETARGAFFIDAPEVLRLDFPGLAPAQAATMTELTRGLLVEYLRQVPVWVLDERDPQQALAKLALRGVTVREGALRFVVGDPE